MLVYLLFDCDEWKSTSSLRLKMAAEEFDTIKNKVIKEFKNDYNLSEFEFELELAEINESNNYQEFNDAATFYFISEVEVE